MGRNLWQGVRAIALCSLMLSTTQAQDDATIATDVLKLHDEGYASRVLWQTPEAPPPVATDLQPSVVDGSTATTEQPRPRTNPSRRSSSASQFALGGGASTVSRRQANTPYMIGDLFGASIYQLSFQAPDIKTTAIYFDASLDSDFLQTFANFDHPGGGAAGLSPINALAAPLGQTSDSSGDGKADVFGGLAEPGGLGAIVLAAQGQPGTIVYVSGTGYLVRQSVFTPPLPFLIPQTAMNSSARGPIDGDPGVPGLATAYDMQFEYLFRPDAVIVNVPSPGGGGAVGRVKIAESNSPIPRDRVFFNYSLFHNVPLTSQGPDVNRYTPGFEKTFWNGNGSIELHVPFASTLDSNLVAGVTNGSNTEFGNATGVLKLLLWSNDNWAFAGGLGVNAPTADDVVVSLPSGRPLIVINNDAFHLQPFLGLLWTPNDRFFAQGFAQVDADIDGNPVWADLQNQGLERFGRLKDATLLVADVGIGYWIYRGGSSRNVTGLAPVWELHYNRSLEDQDVLRQGGFVIGNSGQDVNVLNTTIGLNVELFNNALITAGYTAPLSDDTDRQFDGEFRLMCNIGPRPTRAARAQF